MDAGNVLLEEDAIGPYREQAKIIDDPKIKRLIQRILSDEEAHHGKFAHIVGKVKREGLKDIRGNRTDRTAQELNWGIEHEYTVILQYMYQSYLTHRLEAKVELEDQAINEMQHLGWLSEALASGGGSPRVERTRVDQSPRLADGLRADIKIEKEVAERYDKAGKEEKDANIKKLLFRLRDHERYHAEVFRDLLEEEE